MRLGRADRTVGADWDNGGMVGADDEIRIIKDSMRLLTDYAETTLLSRG